MLGKPIYELGQNVLFKINKEEMDGNIWVIDAWGTFFNEKEVCYDILGTDNCLYKHIPESHIERSFKSKRR